MSRRGYIATLAAATRARQSYSGRKALGELAPLPEWVVDVSNILKEFSKRERLALAIAASLLIAREDADARRRVYAARGDQERAGLAAVEASRAERGLRRLRRRAWAAQAFRRADTLARARGLLGDQVAPARVKVEAGR